MNRLSVLGAMCGALIAAMPAQAPALETGHDLFEMASQNERWSFLVFTAYVAGMGDAAALMSAAYKVPRYACPSPNITHNDTAHAVLVWMRNNPRRLNDSAGIVVVSAMRHAFPCGSIDVDEK